MNIELKVRHDIIISLSWEEEHELYNLLEKSDLIEHENILGNILNQIHDRLGVLP